MAACRTPPQRFGEPLELSLVVLEQDCFFCRKVPEERALGDAGIFGELSDRHVGKPVACESRQRHFAQRLTRRSPAPLVRVRHNGLTAAVILQRAGLRTVVLEQNTYAGVMAATVELIDGFRYEIAGSVQFPTAPEVADVLELHTIPKVHAEVQSVNLGESGEEPMILYSDPMRYMTHLSEKHGDDAVLGMAKMLEWTTGPARALGRFEARTPPKTLDQMYACATNESERRAIHEMLFGSAMDVIDRAFGDKDKYATIRGMLAFLAINSTYRGPFTPGSASVRCVST